ncbi:Uncharacterised protein [Klebsiella pneumoniae]|nr:Uncharacterised protein [Klebsiella pneumoniae]
MDLYVVIGHGDDADVQRSFHDAFRHVRVADNPVRRGVQQTDESVAGSLTQRRFVVIDRFHEHHQVLLFGLQFVFQQRLVSIHQRFQRIGFIRGDGDSSVSFTRDGVAQRAAVEIDQTQIQLIGVAGEEARQQLVGVTQTKVDITAGVAAFQPF